ncbi:hypothetical protein [Morganella morganii]|uniref:hypothetical protein n=1 Tax=Morganella morganii TaxID=582 RepID=UPI001BDB6D3B|nr:hypothetical protein [Morganella morganii]MBT0442261.1 hypothetical protein [Morganella morganii subsp. morganii]
MDILTQSETQILIDYVKGMIQDNKEPEKKAVIALCNEFERVNNLKPVGYTNEDELNYREKEETNGLFFSTADGDCCPIPLYRLDK